MLRTLATVLCWSSYRQLLLRKSYSSLQAGVKPLPNSIISSAFFVCAGYDFALMLKTDFNVPPPNDADTLEKEVGKESG